MKLFESSRNDDYVIIIGCGRLGANLANMLSNIGANVLIMDESRESFRRLDSNYGGLTVVGSGTDFDKLREAQAQGKPWTEALAFDYSLAIGEWLEYDDTTSVELPQADLVISLEEAISEASKLMTIRQGDLIYIQAKSEPRPAHKEDIIKAETNGKETLYCKIK